MIIIFAMTLIDGFLYGMSIRMNKNNIPIYGAWIFFGPKRKLDPNKYIFFGLILFV